MEERTDILDDIVARKRRYIAMWARECPLAELERQLTDTAPHRSLRRALVASPTGIIAEFKRRSPSRGWFNRSADPTQVAPAYERAGAAALSILADEPFFGGSVDDIRRARPLVSIPVLCKDFILSRYQLVRARLVGADAVLLIAAVLTPGECRALTHEAHELGLEVLLEVHRREELDYVSDDVDVVGVNNRDLGTFHTDPARSLELADAFPGNVVRISESGLSSAADVVLLHRAGYSGFLIGESFMRSGDPGAALRTFIQSVDL